MDDTRALDDFRTIVSITLSSSALLNCQLTADTLDMYIALNGRACPLTRP